MIIQPPETEYTRLTHFFSTLLLYEVCIRRELHSVDTTIDREIDYRLKTLHFVQSNTPVQPVPTGSPATPPPPIKKLPARPSLVWTMAPAHPPFTCTGWMRKQGWPRGFFPYWEYIYRVAYTGKRDNDIVVPPTPLRPPLKPKPVDRQDHMQELPLAA